MTAASVSEVKAGLSEFINRAAYGKERIVIMSRGKPKAALIDAETFERFEAWEESLEDAALLKAIAEAKTSPLLTRDQALAYLEAENVV